MDNWTIYFRLSLETRYVMRRPPPPPNPSFFSLTKQINETVLGKALYKGVILNNSVLEIGTIFPHYLTKV